MLSNTLSLESSTSDKLSFLKNSLFEMGSCAVAFSSGVDSTVLSLIASEVLGNKALIVFAISPVVPKEDLEIARRLARKLNFNYLEIEHNQLNLPDFVCNGKDRCFHCRVDLLTQMKAVASSRGITWVCEGSNYDDLSDYRPGLKAVAQLGIRSPLAESFFTKNEIRFLAHGKHLENSDRPSSPCLSSRIPYGTPITEEIIGRIEKGEAYLKTQGLKQVRLRHHGTIARIEVEGTDIERMTVADTRQQIVTALKGLGYKYVTIDLQGFRSGSLNEVLNNTEVSP